MDLLISVLWTLVLLVLIVGACTVFTNAIEWLGHRFKLSEGAVGSVLAAVGTALPETLVPVVALISGAMASTDLSKGEGEAIGIGAILGAPFLLATLAMFVTGVAVFYYSATRQRELTMAIDTHLFKRDFQYFFAAYGAVFLASFIPDQPVKIVLAVVLLFLYGIYVYRTLKIEHIPDSEFHLDPLLFARKRQEPPTGIIVLQVVAGLLGILILAHMFVEEISHLSRILQIDALLLSLIIIPIATELPEKFNSVVWIGNQKDNLALGNITGAMVFQSCVPTAIGLVFTPWQLDFQGILSVVLCMASSLIIYFYAFRRKRMMPYVLLIGGLFYLIFLIYSLSLIGTAGHNTIGHNAS